MSIKFKFAVPVLAMTLGAVAVPALAQNNPGGGGGQNNNGGGGGGGGGFGGGGGRGNYNPQQMQQRMLDRLKTQLGATDDEFSAIEPKLTAVMTAQRDLMGNMFGRGRRGPGGNGGGQNGATQSDLAKALADLQTTLDQQDSTPDDIKGKLDAVRAAKKTARETLSKAQDDLKSVLTQRQEAVLVENGLLE
jgi:flagellar biosynthesis chaperone FliJ